LPFNTSKRMVVLALLMTVAVAGCKKSSEDVFLTRAQELRKRATPAGATTSEPVAIVHSGMAMRTEWQVSSPLSESAFKAFLSQQLEPEFSRVNPGAGRMVYARFSGGDSERLEIIVIKTDGNITQYTVRFTAMPG
jgi:hypothetical protein